jgi:ATP-dependent exoDNAse (exonuclease V) beta subunit
VRDELAAVQAAFPHDMLAAAMDLLQIAASNLATTDKAGSDTARALIHAAELAAGGLAPSADPATLPLWQGLSHLLLTGGGELRSPKGVNVGLGFPSDAGNKAHKQRLQDLLEALASEPDGGEAFAASLGRVRILPPTRYADAHWKVLGAFVEVLRRAFVLLEKVFQATGEVDFSEVALRALRALRDGEMPTDLALALDHRIAHLLVDEFQDTSKNQLRLLERLTEGWAEGDGRTLFVVGDPMQSIYRFRKAEVSLFTQAMEKGIGSVPLTTLRLTENFRSQEQLVEWTNATFAALFPARADPANGAVPFAPATASHPPLAGPAVEVHPIFNADGGAEGVAAAEAATVTKLVQQALADGHKTVAILVAARAHLRLIMPALKAAGITPRVTDIEPLGERPMVRDLVALTRALTHPGDRTAHLAVRRAPWCGHTLADLIAGTPAPRVDAVLAAAALKHRRLPLTRLVQGAWLALGGPSCARDAEDLADARAYFEFLREHEVAGDLDDPAALDELMQELHAPEAPDADPRVQVLTMHKAKGLEFDTVILPGLQRTMRADETALLRWLDRPSPDTPEGVDLLMAALAAAGADRDPIYAYVGELSRQQRAAEQLRQLYVATTRPKQRLHLVGAATLGKDGVKRPPSGSLLRAMWAVVAGAFESAGANAAVPEGARDRTTEVPVQRFRRLSADWKPPVLPAPIAARPRPDAEDPEPYEPFEWNNQTARVVGIVVHRLLQRIAEDGLEQYAEPLLDWDPEKPDAVPPAPVIDARTHAKRATRIASLWPAAEALMEREGLAAQERPKALGRAREAITNTLEDPTGRWILSQHEKASSEQDFESAIDSHVVTLVPDRYFNCLNQVWVVDFKTFDSDTPKVIAASDADAARYSRQLNRYSTVLKKLSGNLVTTALYFTSTNRLLVLRQSDD